MSVLDKNGLGDWVANRLVTIGDTVKDNEKSSSGGKPDPFLDERPESRQNLPMRAAETESLQSGFGRGKRSFDGACSKSPARRRDHGGRFPK